MPRVKITAAICTYKRYELLEKAITSLVNQSMPPSSLEIIVVDNSPDPNASRTQAQRYSEISNLRWIHESIAGLSNARNVAIRESTSDVIAYLDDDAIADVGWANSLRRTFDDFGDLCQVVGGRVDPIWSIPRPKWLTDGMLGYLSVVDLGDESRFLRDGEWVAGANIAYRTRVLRQLNGFDASLGRIGSGSNLMSNEEVDITEKIKRAGGRIVYDPAARVDHLVDASRITQQWFRRRAAWQAVSDCIASSKSDLAIDSQIKWSEIKRYFLHCSPADRTVRALATDQDASGDFEWQLGTVYNFTVCLLSGLSDCEND